VVAGAAALVLLALRPLGPPTTEQREYAFLRSTLRDLPPDCTLAAVSRADKRQWVIPSFLVSGAGAQRAVERAADLAAAPSACLLYVRSSLCSSAEARPTCEAIEREAGLEPIARAAFPAAPSYGELPYDRDPVETVVFRVTAHRLGVNDGIAITPAFAAALYARISPLRAADGCRLTRFDTSRFRVEAALQPPSGEAQAIEFATAPPGSASAWTLVASPAAEQACGTTLAALRRVLAEIGPPTASGATEPNG
jgi:hypothetical protein